MYEKIRKLVNSKSLIKDSENRLRNILSINSEFKIIYTSNIIFGIKYGKEYIKINLVTEYDNKSYDYFVYYDSEGIYYNESLEVL